MATFCLRKLIHLTDDDFHVFFFFFIFFFRFSFFWHDDADCGRYFRFVCVCFFFLFYSITVVYFVIALQTPFQCVAIFFSLNFTFYSCLKLRQHFDQNCAIKKQKKQEKKNKEVRFKVF